MRHYFGSGDLEIFKNRKWANSAKSDFADQQIDPPPVNGSKLIYPDQRGPRNLKNAILDDRERRNLQNAKWANSAKSDFADQQIDPLPVS